MVRRRWQVWRAPVPSPEFALVCACLRRPRDADGVARIGRRAGGVDWQRVEAVAARHRVGGLVADGLRAAGLAVPAALARNARAVASANRLMACETVRLDRALADAGLDALFVKGLTLAALVYGDPGLKMSLDIDVLVDPDAIEAACALLARLGYRRTVPDARTPDAGLREWISHIKEIGWHHPALGTNVDLHGRLTANPALFPGIGLGSARAAVEVLPGRPVATLAPAPLFLYLALHGAETGWGRLKWLGDFAALAALLGPAEVERLYRQAATDGIGRPVAQGLLLAERFLGLDLGALGDALRASLGARLLARLAATSIQGRYEVAPHRPDSLAGIPVLVSHFLLRRGLRHKRAQLALHLANPRDRARARLPAGWGWLYPVLSLGRLMRRPLRRVRLATARVPSPSDPR